MRHASMTAVGALLIIGNLYVVLQPPPVWHAAANPLPRSAALRDAFLLPGMFSTYSRENAEPFIGGERTSDGDTDSRGQWIPLSVAASYPHDRGVTYTRFYAMHHRDLWGHAGQQRAWAFAAATIRARHNRLHPQRRIDRVRLGVLRWPKSPGGYVARKTAREVQVTTFYVEPADP